MPLIHYSCECGTSVSKFYRQGKDAPSNIECEKCHKKAKKMLKAPFSTSKISIDNGIQARAVEINPEIVEENQERNKDYREE